MASPDVEGINKAIHENEVCVFTKSHCPYSKRARALLDSLKVKAHIVEIDTAQQPTELQAALAQYLKREKVTVPQVFVQHGAHYLGGCSDVEALHKDGKLVPFLFPVPPTGGAAQVPAQAAAAGGAASSTDSAAATPSKVPKDEAHGGGGQDAVSAHIVNGANEQEAEGSYDYDLIVLGGGSGGLAAAKEAAHLGAKVAVFDYVVPTPQGTKWGLGGTCVNVGCIPKKLMHQAALHREGFKDAVNFGWQLEPEAIKHDWSTMIENIQTYIKSLNFAYRKALKKDDYKHKVEYINAYAQFISPHTVQYKIKEVTKTLTARYFMVAVGLRPTYPENTPGAKEYCITSDDLFSLRYFPGRTLVVGASYVALECAGFMKGVGVDVTIAVRSIYLRGFDQQMADMVGQSLVDHGVRILRPCVPTQIEKVQDGKPGLYKVTLEMTQDDGTKKIEVEEFNTILLAIGRTVRTDLGFETIGLKTHRDGKLLVDDADKTNVPYVYAIGDVAHGGYRKELTPVAIEAGVLLARRLFSNSTVLAEYDKVATTVFTPMEYGAIGLSEEEAIAKYGAENLEVYHIKFNPLEWRLRQDGADDMCYAKLICLKTQNELVVGFHVLGANAGEITQGYAVAIKLNATKADFDRTIGIHPTESEVFTTLDVTKASGKSAGGKSC